MLFSCGFKAKISATMYSAMLSKLRLLPNRTRTPTKTLLWEIVAEKLVLLYNLKFNVAEIFRCEDPPNWTENLLCIGP